MLVPLTAVEIIYGVSSKRENEGKIFRDSLFRYVDFVIMGLSLSKESRKLCSQYSVRAWHAKRDQ